MISTEIHCWLMMGQQSNPNRAYNVLYNIYIYIYTPTLLISELFPRQSHVHQLSQQLELVMESIFHIDSHNTGCPTCVAPVFVTFYLVDGQKK